MASTSLLDATRDVISSVQAGNRILTESTDKLRQTDKEYSRYNSALDAASAALGKLKKRAEMDNRLLWLAWYFFMAVAAWIFLRRTGIWWIALTTLKTAYYTSSSLTEVAVKVFNAVVSKGSQPIVDNTPFGDVPEPILEVSSTYQPISSHDEL